MGLNTIVGDEIRGDGALVFWAESVPYSSGFIQRCGGLE